MHLRIIEVTNYRGIKHLELKLNVITGVFGEGSFGKTSLVQALYSCLGPCVDKAGLPCFTEKDFYREDKNSISNSRRLSISLTFRESVSGQWEEARYDRLQEVICDWRGKRSQLTLKVVATRHSDTGEIEVDCQFLDPKGKIIKTDNSQKILECLRNLNPVILIDPYDVLLQKVEKQSLISRNKNHGDSIPKDELEGIFDTFRHALTGPRSMPLDRLDEALKLLSRSNHITARLLDSQIALCRHYIENYGSRKKQSNNSRFDNSFQLKALFYLLIAIYESTINIELHSDCQPIIAVENLESNTHPILLASIWGMIAQTPIQKLMVTNSYDLLSSMPLASLRRVVSTTGGLLVHQIKGSSFSNDELRRIGYHLQGNRSDSIMARCWLLVEGESEFWLMPEMAHILGIDFKVEGIRCIEFSQCGLQPLVKLARALGIEWHVLTDGDQSGMAYANITRRLLKGEDETLRLTKIPELNIEHLLCKNGFKDVYFRAAGRNARRKRTLSNLISHAVKRHPKPSLILAVVEIAQKRGSSSVPYLIRQVIQTSLKLSRSLESVYFYSERV